MSFIPAKLRPISDIWNRSGKLARLTLYIACLDVAFFLLQRLFRLLKLSAVDYVSGWTTYLGVAALVLAIIVFLRWVRRTLMWRLRNRLIITYVFIGVIPVVLLLAIGIIAAYLFAGQFASFVVTSDFRSERLALQAANSILAGDIANHVRQGVPLDKAIDMHRLSNKGSSFPGRAVTIFVKERDGSTNARSVPSSAPPIRYPGRSDHTDFGGIFEDGDHLYVRAVNIVDTGKQRLTVISSVPLGKDSLERFAADLGEITVYPPDLTASLSTQEPGFQQQHGDLVVQGENLLIRPAPGSKELVPSLPPLIAGSLPPAWRYWDREVLFGTPYSVVDWETNRTATALLRVRTRPSLLYGRLFLTVGDFAGVVLIVLAGIGVFFALIELLALIIGVRLTRTMTRSVAALYTATQHINRGEFSHRIQIRSTDQLAELETSFNSMTNSLENLIAEQKEKERMQGELAIAQEVQAQLFPRGASELGSLEMHGLCRPARTVSGDYYDFLPLGPEKLGIAVGDVSGKGISAALLMATIHSAVRVYEIGVLPSREQFIAAGAAALSSATGNTSLVSAGILESPAKVLSLLNRHLFRSTPMEKYATMFLGIWDGHQHTLTYCNAGHLPPLIISNDGSIRKLETGGMVIGLFDNIEYEEATIQLRPGDLFVAYSDGITEPENEFGEFGEHRLIGLLRESRDFPLERISDAVVAAVHDWIGAAEQPDDVTIVLARAC